MCPIDVIEVGFEKLCTEGSRLITVMPDVIPEAHTEEGCALDTQMERGSHIARPCGKVQREATINQDIISIIALPLMRRGTTCIGNGSLER